MSGDLPLDKELVMALGSEPAPAEAIRGARSPLETLTIDGEVFKAAGCPLDWRALDSLVATLVAGWTDIQPRAWTPAGQHPCGTLPKHSRRRSPWDNGRGFIPSYSLLIQDAFELVELLADPRRPRSERFFGFVGRTSSGLSFACFQRGRHIGELEFHAEAERPALAICLAALAACGATVEVSGGSPPPEPLRDAGEIYRRLDAHISDLVDADEVGPAMTSEALAARWRAFAEVKHWLADELDLPSPRAEDPR